MIAVSPAGCAEAGNLYAWQPSELSAFVFPTANPIKGKYYQLPANTQTIPPIYFNEKELTCAGVAATPKTWADLLDASSKLKGEGDHPIRHRRRHGRASPPR